MKDKHTLTDGIECDRIKGSPEVYRADQTFHGASVKWHFEHTKEKSMAACRGRSILLDLDDGDEPIRIYAHERCGSAGCAKLWRAYDRSKA